MWIEMKLVPPPVGVLAMSCHVCGMWIEMQLGRFQAVLNVSCHVCGMWIEIEVPRTS